MIEKISDHVWHWENLCHTLFSCKLGYYLRERSPVKSKRLENNPL